MEQRKTGIVRCLERAKENTEEEKLAFTRFGEVRTIPVKNIRQGDGQPRKEQNPEGLRELTISVMEYGLMQPIAVRQTGMFEYELIAGGRRLTVCRNLGMAYIPAIVLPAGEEESILLALTENLQREDLTFIEEAEAYARVMKEFHLTQEQLARKLGKSQSAIANKVRILKLSPEVRGVLEKNHLSERHARALLRLPEEKQRLRAAHLIAERKFSVSKTEDLVDRLLRAAKEKEKETKKAGHIIGDVRVFQNTIRQAVAMMRRGGIPAGVTKKENDTAIAYTIIIPKL